MITYRIRRIALEENVSVFGIGPAAAMADEPAGFRPADYLPHVRSVVCFGIPVPRHAYRTRNGAEIAWRSQNLLYRRLDALALRCSIMLEESGESAVPVYGCMPLGINERGTVVGYVNQLRMAEAAGIGAIGNNGLLLHSLYGSRLMLGGLLTTASLRAMRDPDHVTPGCPPGCQICADECPVKAIMPEKKKVRIMRCLRYTARTPLMSRLKFLYLRMRSRAAAARYMSLTAFDEHTFHICSKCVSSCPYGEG